MVENSGFSLLSRTLTVALLLGMGNRFAAEAKADEQSDKLQAALNNGVNYLRNSVLADKFARTGADYQTPAIIGIALLEAGVPADSPEMKKIIERMKKRLNGNYQVEKSSYVILFWNSYLRHKKPGTNHAEKPKQLPFSPPIKDMIEIRLSNEIPEFNGKIGISDSLEEYLARWIVFKHLDTTRGNIKTKPVRRFKEYVHDKLDSLTERKIYRDPTSPHGWDLGPVGGKARGSNINDTCSAILAFAAVDALNNERKSKDTWKKQLENNAVIRAGRAWLSQEFKYRLHRKSEIDPHEIRIDPTGYIRKMWCLCMLCNILKWETLDGKEPFFPHIGERLLASQQMDGRWGLFKNVDSLIVTSWAVMILSQADLAPSLTYAVTTEKPLKPEFQWTPPPPPKKPEPKPKPEPTPTTPDAAKEAKSAGSRSELIKLLNKGQPALTAAVIDEFSKRKGRQYTEGLAELDLYLDGDPRKVANTKLHQRLSRLTSDSLSQMMNNSSKTLRLAVITVAAQKGYRELTPQLIELLTHDNPQTQVQAQQALITLWGDPKFAKPNTVIERIQLQQAWKRRWYRLRAR